MPASAILENHSSCCLKIKTYLFIFYQKFHCYINSVTFMESMIEDNLKDQS